MHWPTGDRRVVALAVVLLAGFAAMSRPAQSPAETTAEFTVHGTRGYSIEIRGSSRGRVSLTAFGPAGSATYVVLGRVSSRRIVANFGKRGRVAVTFRSDGDPLVERPARRCKGRPRVTQSGKFVGAIRFHGELGFTRARARRAKGSTKIDPRWRCKGGDPDSRMLRSSRYRDADSGGTEDGAVLKLFDRQRRLEVEARLFFFSVTLGPIINYVDAPTEESPEIIFRAAMEEQRGRMAIRRRLEELGEDSDFEYDESLHEATLMPPFPFAGVGRFERTEGGASWTGSLSLALPGTARIPLSAPRFSARLYRAD